MLTTKFSEWGAEQFVTYRNQDRHEEEVHEIVEGPCAISPLCASQLLETHASLIIGDCNAGKTTLLHALTDESQFLPFLHLQSLIPSVFGTFHNYRFCDVNAIRTRGLDPMALCCDHADQKFLDTDISKVSISLTKADWRYLMDELGLEPRAVAADVTRYTLVEMGGDHLDRLQNQMRDWAEFYEADAAKIDRTMSGQTLSQTPSNHCHRTDDELFKNPRIDEICAHSRALLANPKLKGVSYFINGRTAAGLDISGESDDVITAGPIQIQKFYVAQLRRRLKLLATLCPHLQHLDVYVARLPPTARTPDFASANPAGRNNLPPDPDAAMLDILSSVVGQDHVDRFELSYRRTATSELFKELAELVKSACRDLLPAYVVVNVHPFELMESEPSVPPTVDVCAVYSFMRNSLISSLTGLGAKASDPEMLENLVTFFEGARYCSAARDPHAALCNVWYTLTDLVEYEGASELSMPLPILVANFHRLMDELAAAKVCCVGAIPKTVPELWSKCFCDTADEPLPLQKTLRITSAGKVILDWSVEADSTSDRHYRFPIEEPLFQKAMAAIRAACRVKPDSVDWVLIRKEGVADVGARVVEDEQLSMREVLMLSFDQQLAAGGGETHFSVPSKCGLVSVRVRGGLLDFSFTPTA